MVPLQVVRSTHKQIGSVPSGCAAVTDTADVVVVGAGISGASAAYELARAGLRTMLLDRYAPAGTW